MIRMGSSGEQSKFGKETCVKRYHEMPSVKWKKMRVNEAKRVDEEWDVLWEGVLTCVREVCYNWKVGDGHVKKGSG